MIQLLKKKIQKYWLAIQSRLLIAVLAGFTAQQLSAQQTPLFNTSLINPVLENPALTGHNKYAQAWLHYKNQWIDIEGAPESALMTIDWPLKDEKSGLLLNLSSDVTNILGHIGIMAAYSHAVKINDEQRLRFGLGIRLNHNTIYFNKVEAENQFESALFNYSESATGVNVNFGASYTFKALRAELAVFNMVNSKLQYTNSTKEKELNYQYIPQYLVKAGYEYPIREDLSIRPEIGIRDIQGMPVQLEASVFSMYKKKYGAGIVFRNGNSLGFLVSMLAYERLNVSYAYQSALGDLSGYNGGTHEVALGYRFFTSHYQQYKPGSNYQLDEIITKAELKTAENKELKQEKEELKEQLKQEKEEIEHLKVLMEKEKENASRAREESAIALEELPEELIYDPDMPVYIILGVFSETHSAKYFQQVLRREHQLGTEVLRRKNSSDYIVCVNNKYKSKNDLKKGMVKLKRICGNYSDGDVWIYVNK